ncbi:MAG: hypothetical protein IKK59_00390 [Lachnospiraceae bacterium]|nr:hypothetical protein [Lachnospiraceae bacterium]MBR3761178.1 hypothetical protein [Lachnospiraceae bacterium]
MKNLVKGFLMAKDNGDKAIVVEVGLAVIAVVLLVVFQGKMTTFVESLVDLMTGEIKDILTTGTGAVV